MLIFLNFNEKKFTLRMCVSLESRYGTWVFPFVVSALMQLPKAERDLLMFFASSKVLPLAPVLDTFSEPEEKNVISRSTIVYLPGSYFYQLSLLNLIGRSLKIHHSSVGELSR